MSLSFNQCEICDQKRETYLRCAGCHLAAYCSRECQRKDWKASHKYFCNIYKCYVQVRAGGGDLADFLLVPSSLFLLLLRPLGRSLPLRGAAWPSPPPPLTSPFLIFCCLRGGSWAARITKNTRPFPTTCS